MGGPFPKQGSVSWVTKKRLACPVTPESGLVLEDILMTPTRVETRLTIYQIMVIGPSRPWGTSWCSEF